MDIDTVDGVQVLRKGAESDDKVAELGAGGWLGVEELYKGGRREPEESLCTAIGGTGGCLIVSFPWHQLYDYCSFAPNPSLSDRVKLVKQIQGLSQLNNYGAERLAQQVQVIRKPANTILAREDTEVHAATFICAGRVLQWEESNAKPLWSRPPPAAEYCFQLGAGDTLDAAGFVSDQPGRHRWSALAETSVTLMVLSPLGLAHALSEVPPLEKILAKMSAKAAARVLPGPKEVNASRSPRLEPKPSKISNKSVSLAINSSAPAPGGTTEDPTPISLEPKPPPDERPLEQRPLRVPLLLLDKDRRNIAFKKQFKHLRQLGHEQSDEEASGCHKHSSPRYACAAQSIGYRGYKSRATIGRSERAGQARQLLEEIDPSQKHPEGIRSARFSRYLPERSSFLFKVPATSREPTHVSFESKFSEWIDSLGGEEKNLPLPTFQQAQRKRTKPRTLPQIPVPPRPPVTPPRVEHKKRSLATERRAVRVMEQYPMQMPSIFSALN